MLLYIQKRVRPVVVLSANARLEPTCAEGWPMRSSRGPCEALGGISLAGGRRLVN